MNREKHKKSQSTPSGGIIAWLYDLLFSRKNRAVDEATTPPARETIPEHNSGRAEQIFAQIQQDENNAAHTARDISATTIRAAHQDDSGTSIHHAASASGSGGSSSDSSDPDSGSSGCD